jgi:hypothetical protein
LGVSAVTATAAYLKLLWSNFHGTFGHPIFYFEYHLVIPVPASWPLYARQMMLEAIRQADILSAKVHLAPKFVADIEAASIALLTDLGKPRDYRVSKDFRNVCPLAQFSSNTSSDQS